MAWVYQQGPRLADAVAGRFRFFLLQSTLLNWMGIPAMGILVLLMFFSMPLLNMAPEFLPQATQDWLYSWTPLRFGASALRDVMYFDGYAPSSSHSAVMWFIAGGFLVLFAGLDIQERETFRPKKIDGRF